MSRRAGRWLGILGLVLVPLSCTALPGARTQGEELAVEQLPAANVVPVEWGPLVAVTPIPETTTSALWFQDDAGAVHLVTYEHETQTLWSKTRVIRRR